ncbi:hypothetical protein FKW77_001492 [Venturia effusa]|uniref:F-box domain-containing protein n=1 Tax=Venturia effusa TaxID=50376 RepID=A0A517LKU8_9PEZI|nr:hypothetical protein FKW77_001492 [Venturia effusa]
MANKPTHRNLDDHATNFLDLPLELRREIYHYCLPPKPYAVCVGLFVPRYSLRSSHAIGLLSASKQLNHEALDILYGEALCKYDFHMQKGAYFGEYFSDENRRRVRKIRVLLDVDVDNEANSTSTQLVAGFEDPVLARMTKIEIVAALPRLSGRYPNMDQVDVAQEIWLGRFEELIRCIARATSPTLIIEIDDNNQEQTSAIVYRYLGTRCRKVQTDSGDLYFKRKTVKEEK